MVINIQTKSSDVNSKYLYHLFQVLSKTILEPSKIEWLDACLDYFHCHAKKIYKQHRGHITGEKVKKKHASFLNKFIDTSINTDIMKVNSENKSGKDLAEGEVTEAGK